MESLRSSCHRNVRPPSAACRWGNDWVLLETALVWMLVRFFYQRFLNQRIEFIDEGSKTLKCGLDRFRTGHVDPRVSK